MLYPTYTLVACLLLREVPQKSRTRISRHLILEFLQKGIKLCINCGLNLMQTNRQTELERWSEWLIIFVNLHLNFALLWDHLLRLLSFFTQNFHFKTSWNHCVLSDQPCTVPLTIKGPSKNKSYHYYKSRKNSLQITSALLLLQIATAFLSNYNKALTNCDRYYKLRQNYYESRQNKRA